MSLCIDGTSIVVSDERTITLGQMKSVKLMNRTDSKYVGPAYMLEELLAAALRQEYSVQISGGGLMAEYDTCYFDTPSCDCYLMHHNGRLSRQKLRTRLYRDSSTAFLEIKDKTNSGRTKKKRIEIPLTAVMDWKAVPEAAEFVKGRLRFPAGTFSAALQTSFRRITLVNKERTERVTIDTGLKFSNLRNGNKTSIGNIMIVEVKQDGSYRSVMKGILTKLGIRRMGFSKYCMGTALTDPAIKQNRFKEKLRFTDKLQSHVKHIAVSAGV